jgi:hypothetical protein
MSLFKYVQVESNISDADETVSAEEAVAADDDEMEQIDFADDVADDEPITESQSTAEAEEVINLTLGTEYKDPEEVQQMNLSEMDSVVQNLHRISAVFGLEVKDSPYLAELIKKRFAIPATSPKKDRQNGLFAKSKTFKKVVLQGSEWGVRSGGVRGLEVNVLIFRAIR